MPVGQSKYEAQEAKIGEKGCGHSDACRRACDRSYTCITSSRNNLSGGVCPYFEKMGENHIFGCVHGWPTGRKKTKMQFRVDTDIQHPTNCTYYLPTHPYAYTQRFWEQCVEFWVCGDIKCFYQLLCVCMAVRHAKIKNAAKMPTSTTGACTKQNSRLGQTW